MLTAQQKNKSGYVDNLYSCSHVTNHGTEELLLPIDFGYKLKPVPTSLVNNSYLNQNQILVNYQLNNLMQGQTQGQIQGQVQAQNGQQLQGNSMGIGNGNMNGGSADIELSMGMGLENQPPAGLQNEAVSFNIPPFHPSTFHSVPVNRHLQTAVTQNEPPRRSRSGTIPRILSIHAPEGVELYEATYSNIDVYELIINGVQCMRRRDDGWVNATHILKVAGVEKGRRTKILDREVNLTKFEKVQGGYGKYQGTWVSLEDAKMVAMQFNAYPQLAPILDIP